MVAFLTRHSVALAWLAAWAHGLSVSRCAVPAHASHLARVPTLLLAEKPAPKGKKDGPDGPYRTSVLLPSTSFSQRANSVTREPELQKWWHDQAIYESLRDTNTGDKFVLHDGPPYANGDLHIGHALNKILKDFINRYQMLQVRVFLLPRSHVLPISLSPVCLSPHMPHAHCPSRTADAFFVDTFCLSWSLLIAGEEGDLRPWVGLPRPSH